MQSRKKPAEIDQQPASPVDGDRGDHNSISRRDALKVASAVGLLSIGTTLPTVSNAQTEVPAEYVFGGFDVQTREITPGLQDKMMEVIPVDQNTMLPWITKMSDFTLPKDILTSTKHAWTGAVNPFESPIAKMLEEQGFKPIPATMSAHVMKMTNGEFLTSFLTRYKGRDTTATAVHRYDYKGNLVAGDKLTDPTDIGSIVSHYDKPQLIIFFEETPGKVATINVPIQPKKTYEIPLDQLSPAHQLLLFSSPIGTKSHGH